MKRDTDFIFAAAIAITFGIFVIGLSALIVLAVASALGIGA